MPSASLAPPYDPTTAATAATDYARIARAIQFLHTNAAAHPSLDDLAAHLNLSPFHLQRLFTRWAGVSPKRFLQALTLEHAKRLLAGSASVLQTTYAAGLTSPGRLHDLFVSIEAVTPGEFKTGGAGLTLRYGSAPTPFGPALLAWSNRGLCTLHFLDGSSHSGELTIPADATQIFSASPGRDASTCSPGQGREAAAVLGSGRLTTRAAQSDSLTGPMPARKILPRGLTEPPPATTALATLRATWPHATFAEDPPAARRWIDRIFRRSQRDLPPIRLHLQGTNFQIQVWRALLRIPEGAAVSYAAVANYVQRPTATRAVASAIGANPVAWLIPCHRVLRATGALGGYRWGTDRKQALLARESAQATP